LLHALHASDACSLNSTPLKANPQIVIYSDMPAISRSASGDGLAISFDSLPGTPESARFLDIQMPQVAAPMNNLLGKNE
jgi:hypothetical protein